MSTKQNKQSVKRTFDELWSKDARVVALVACALVISACRAVPLAQPVTTATTAAGPSAQTSEIAQNADKPGPVHCNILFEATIRQGPSTGTSLMGSLDFKLDRQGSLSGTLTLKDHTEIPVVGQVTGRAVNLAMRLADRAYVFGVGTAFKNIDNEECGYALGGPFAGPKAGDLGEWLAIGRGTPASTPGDQFN